MPPITHPSPSMAGRLLLVLTACAACQSPTIPAEVDAARDRALAEHPAQAEPDSFVAGHWYVLATAESGCPYTRTVAYLGEMEEAMRANALDLAAKRLAQAGGGFLETGAIMQHIGERPYVLPAGELRKARMFVLKCYASGELAQLYNRSTRSIEAGVEILIPDFAFAEGLAALHVVDDSLMEE